MAFQLWIRYGKKSDQKIKVSVANSEEEFKNTTVEEIKRKALSEDEYENYILVHYSSTLKKSRTLGSYGIKHEDNITKVPKGSTYTVRSQTQSSESEWTEETRSIEDDDDDEEVKDISRRQSMDNLALMGKINLSRKL